MHVHSYAAYYIVIKAFFTHLSPLFVLPYNTVHYAGSIFPKRELKFVDMISYFPRILRDDHLCRVAEDIFLGGLRIKPRLRKGVWPHLVRVFHPGMETREERESYLGKLRLIYDALKGSLQSQADSPVHQNRRHLYDSIRRDAMRTDPTESFYKNGRRNDRSGPGDGSVNATSSMSIESSYLSRENIEKLVNITAVYTLEHDEVSYTQGMTDLLSPILYVMEREDDAYIVFSAMVQRIAENFGTWCEGTLKKVERLRHLCAVLDPELSAYLKDIEEDAFALFFGMVLIECRREFSFENSFHLMEVIWSAALCMRQREDPNWSPPPPTTPTQRGRRDNRRIQVLSPEPPSLTGLGSVPTHSEWASFMSNRSPDVIRQVFGELQTYTAVPLARSECGSITHSTFLVSHTPPPLRNHRSSLDGSMEGAMIPEEDLEQSGPPDAATRVISVEVHDRVNLETGEMERNRVEESENHWNSSRSRVRGSGDEMTQQRCLEEDEPSATPMATNASVAERSRFAYSPGKDRSLSDPVRCRVNRSLHEPSEKHSNPSPRNRDDEPSTPPTESRFVCSERGGEGAHPNGANQSLRRSCSASCLTPSPPPSSPPVSPSPVILATRTQTEMSDMSSVESTNAGGGGGGGGTTAASNDKSGLDASMGVEGGAAEDGREEEEGRGEVWVEIATPLENGLHTPQKLDEEEDCTILAADTPCHSAVTDDTPSSRERTDSTLQEQSLTRHTEYPPVSPVQPFCDTLEMIASLSRPNSPAPPPEETSHHAAVFANLLSTEHAVPVVSRVSSLTVPFSDSFPLFICLAIIIQQRSRILCGNLDFVGLSVLLNTQAGAQNLDRTLRIARQLYERYRGYQRLCFGPRFSVYEVWLDNMESLFASLPSPRATAPNAGRQNVRNGSALIRERDAEDV